MKEGHGRAGDWATNLGRLSHGYRGDNITLIVMPAPLTPRSLLKSQRRKRGLRHHVECPPMADAAIETGFGTRSTAGRALSLESSFPLPMRPL